MPLFVRVFRLFANLALLFWLLRPRPAASFIVSVAAIAVADDRRHNVHLRSFTDIEGDCFSEEFTGILEVSKVIALLKSANKDKRLASVAGAAAVELLYSCL